MKAYFTILFIFAVTFSTNGQNRIKNMDPYSSLKVDTMGYNPTLLRVDGGIEENYFKHLIYNNNNPEIMGYRIRIFSGSGFNAKKEANNARSRFLSKYPEIGAYLNYDAPDYKVYVGDCRTRSEVLKLFNEIKSDFPYAFIPPKQAIDYEKYKSLIADE